MNRDNFKWDSAELKWILKKFLSQTVGPKSLEQTIDEFVASHSIGNEEWEIVSFRTKEGPLHQYDSKEKFDKFYEGEMDWHKDKMVEKYLAKKDWEIFSVLRKSDGTTWTVGEIFFNDFGGDYSEHTIDRFEVENGELKCRVEKTDKSFYQIDHLKKLPQRTKPPLGPLSREVEKLEERIAYIEKKLNIEG